MVIYYLSDLRQLKVKINIEITIKSLHVFKAGFSIIFINDYLTNRIHCISAYLIGFWPGVVKSSGNLIKNV